MNVVRTFVPNSLKNYNHLVICPHTREAAAIDPFDAQHLIKLALDQKVTITQIWVTHEHGDHIRALEALKQQTHAKVIAPETCQGLFEADDWLIDNEKIELGQCHAICRHTPGHTKGHAVYFGKLSNHSDFGYFLMCGDTLFNAGVGNVRSGNVKELYDSIEMLKQWLPDDCAIYNGHDYAQTNLRFTLHHCPELDAATTNLETVNEQNADTRTVFSWADEKQHNLFLQLGSQNIERITGVVGSPTNHAQQFSALRKLRDAWNG